jgi:SAM-dependent methyltransferase
MEISRVLKPGGLVFLIAPSRGHRHGTYDCWRFYPDSMRALAAFARMELLEAYVDMPPRKEESKRLDYAAIDSRRSYWGDAVGVFRKPTRPSLQARVMGELVTRWANRVGELESVPRRSRGPRQRRRRAAAGRPTESR